MTVLLIAISVSLAYSNDEDAIGEGLVIDGEGYIGPFLANTSDTGNYTSNLSSNNTGLSENTSNNSENGPEIGEGLVIDDEGYIGPFLANSSNNSSKNASNLSPRTYEAHEVAFYPEIDRESLVMDIGFDKGFLEDFQGIMGHFGGFTADNFFDGRRHRP
jgi:hypothetical protein